MTTSIEAGPGASTIPTWDVLLNLGFVVDPDVISESKPGLSCDFGNLKLTAGHLCNRYWKPVVVLGGILSTPRTGRLIEGEMPVEVESVEQAKAWLAWTLDGSDHEKFEPAIATQWLHEGRLHSNLLPWERERAQGERERAQERAVYEASPHCSVPRDWARFALNSLTDHLSHLAENVAVTFRFDGRVLSIECDGKTIPMPATGKAWPHGFTINAAKLRKLPKRFINDEIVVSVLDSTLRIAGWPFREAFPARETADTPTSINAPEDDPNCERAASACK